MALLPDVRWALHVEVCVWHTGVATAQGPCGQACTPVCLRDGAKAVGTHVARVCVCVCETTLMA